MPKKKAKKKSEIKKERTIAEKLKEEQERYGTQGERKESSREIESDEEDKAVDKTSADEWNEAEDLKDEGF